MPRSAFSRAKQDGASPSLAAVIVMLSVCGAVLIPLLIVDLGLIVQLLVSRGSSEVPNDFVLGPLVSGRWFDWPIGGSYDLTLLWLVLLGAAAAICEALTYLLLERAVHRQAIQVTATLRDKIHDQAFRLGTHDLLGVARSRPEALFVERVEEVVKGLVAWWRTIPGSWIALACLVILALAVNFWLALLAGVLAASILWLYRGLRERAAARSQHWRKVRRAQMDLVKQHLDLAPVSIGYALDEPPGERFAELLSELGQTEYREQTSDAVNKPTVLLTVLLATGFLLLVIGLREDVTVAGAVVLGVALIGAYFPAARLVRLKQRLGTADAAATEIYSYLDRESTVSEASNAQPLERVRESVRLQQITLADRRGKRLLDQVSLTISAGTRVAILASDSQASIAMAGLFVRFYDPAAGRILYDDHDICRATLETVRGQALLVAGKGPLLPGTVGDNISCGDSGFTALQIADAAKRAKAYDFVQKLPQGFATNVAKTTFSPDQHFRIALARALLREPSLLVIEEPEDVSDEATMHEIEAAIKQASAGRTVVLLPNMILSLRTADRVYLLHEGKLMAEGTHAELLQNNELYRHINYVRFNPFRHKVKG